MKTKTIISIAMLLSLIFVVATSELFAQSNPRFIALGGGVKGALYTPDSGPAPHVGILVMHRVADNMSALACTELAKRGFMVLGANTRFENNESLVRWESIILDVKRGVNFLRSQPGIKKVILLGGSGGGPLMTYYQAVAENGPSYCKGPNKLVECGVDVAGLPAADGIILRDAHPGNGVNALRSLNPAVINDPAVLNENRPAQINPALDSFNEKNGYNPKGPSTYSQEFKKKYFKAQSDRMNFLIDEALKRLKQIGSGTYKYPDDDAFIIVKGDNARLMQLDLSIHHSTVKPQKLLKNDGTIERCCIVESVRVPSLKPKDNEEFGSGTMFLTARSFLSTRAIRSTDSMDGIDWCSSNNSTPCALQKISVPLLVTAMGGHYFIRDSEILYESAASRDKDFVVIEGATHGITPCRPCEKFPGQYSNSVKNWADYLRDWINERF